MLLPGISNLVILSLQGKICQVNRGIAEGGAILNWEKRRGKIKKNARRTKVKGPSAGRTMWARWRREVSILRMDHQLPP
jgi:hypothetical protein